MKKVKEEYLIRCIFKNAESISISKSSIIIQFKLNSDDQIPKKIISNLTIRGFLLPNVEVAENAEKKISIQLYDNKYFYGTFNLNFSLQNKQLQQILPTKLLSFFFNFFKFSVFVALAWSHSKELILVYFQYSFFN